MIARARAAGVTWRNWIRDRRCLAALLPGIAGYLCGSPTIEGSQAASLPLDLLSGAPSCSFSRAPEPVDLAQATARALGDQPQLVIARQNLLESRTDVTAARMAFLPNAVLSASDESYRPGGRTGPVVMVGNNVLGGPQTMSGYASLDATWNLFNSGRDVAGYRGARAEVRSSVGSLDSQEDDTLIGLLQAYAALYEAQVTLENEADTVAASYALEARARERYGGGHGTTIAVGQARESALQAVQSFQQDCRQVWDKSQGLLQAIGTPRTPEVVFAAPVPLPGTMQEEPTPAYLMSALDDNPAVVAAREQIAVARQKLKQAEGEYGPTVSLMVRRDYLGQDPDSISEANRHIGPEGLRIGITFQQALFPTGADFSDARKAAAELRKAQASYQQARLNVGAKMEGALSAQSEAIASYDAGEKNVVEALKVLELTQSLYHSGRAGMDDVQRAQMDLDKARTDLRILTSQKLFAAWNVQYALSPSRFPGALFKALHIEVQGQLLNEDRSRQ